MTAIPSKALAALVKSVAAHTLFSEGHLLTFEQIFDELLGPAGFSVAQATELLQAIQKSLALAAHGDLNDKDFSAAVDRFPSVTATPGVKDALRSWWGDNREAVRLHLLSASNKQLGRPTLDSIEWRVNTTKASSLPSSGADPSSGALPDDAAANSASVTLSLSLSNKAVITAQASKEVLADLLATVEAARKEGEKILGEGGVR